jgi:hypothetical protein
MVGFAELSAIVVVTEVLNGVEGVMEVLRRTAQVTVAFGAALHSIR